MSLEILSLTSLPEDLQHQIINLDKNIKLTMAPGWFDGEIRYMATFTVDRYLSRMSHGQATKEERDKLLNDAEVILVGFPFPLDLRARSPKLKWVHQRPAGLPICLEVTYGKSDIVVTSSRGYAHNLPIAEYTIATMLHFAKDLHLLSKSAKLNNLMLEAIILRNYGKTLCVLGAGGIGTEVGRLASAL